MIKQAVILAAGRGKRMKKSADPSHSSRPKPLLEINKMPIIERSIKKLAESGLEVAVVINPSDENLFRELLGAYKIRYCYQDKPLGTAHALFCAKEFVNDDLFLVLMGDDIANLSLKKVLAASEPTVFGHEVEDVSAYGVIVTDKTGKVEEIVEKKMTGRGMANTGIYIMPKLFFDIYREIPMDEKTGEYFLTHAPRIMRNSGIIFQAEKVDFWFGVNTPEELEKARSLSRLTAD